MSTRSTTSRRSSTTSSAWSWSDGPDRGPGTTTRVRERQLPNTPSVKALLWFTGRHPDRVKSVKVYETTWNNNDNDDAMSDWSGSGYSWPWGGDRQKLVEVFLVETAGGYYYDEEGG